ncbi:alpha/beta fold hydrolase [Pseudonocardia sp. HH130630-07]|uniref:alpha/beta fold hydrolase n=1 Tax=Pseudonocardia sp. HH130630-07 TaxID=1690815 RepID=UPI001E2D3715|nr:alpha/beta fold hydrolase [Pseudonocardia sp. HH130630-07]
MTTAAGAGAGSRVRRVVADDGTGLHCEVFGAGRDDAPPLLLVQGGVSEAGATRQLADRLAQRFRVISYDRRGLSRSDARVPPAGISLWRHAADAAAVVTAVAARPAVVLGSSIGALIGLHLAVAHPDVVSTVIAHEPPMSTVIGDPEREAGLDRVAAAARHDVFAAVAEMGALIGGDR